MQNQAKVKKPAQAKVYKLQGDKEPISLLLNSKDCKSKSLVYWDEGKGENRALRYAPNQKSPFMDEQDDKARLEHVVFTDGKLTVSPKQPALDKFLSVHPDNKANGGYVFELVDHSVEAREDNEFLDFQLEALNIAKDINLSQAEAVIRALKPNVVDRMDSDSIKRDARLYARDYPVEFLDMVNDPNAELDNMIALAKELRIIHSNSNDTEIYIKNKGDKADTKIIVTQGMSPNEAVIKYLRSNPDAFKAIERAVNVTV